MADKCDVEVVIKLGGCAVTDKRTFETVKHEAILAAAKLVKQIEGKCIVIHGAGWVDSRFNLVCTDLGFQTWFAGYDSHLMIRPLSGSGEGNRSMR